MNAAGVITSRPIVYLVEDDASFQASLRALFESVDLQVECFGEPAGLLRRLDEAARSLPESGVILADIRLPAMSGLELLRELRNCNVYYPVVFLTGYGSVPIAVEALKGGAIDFLEKPVPPQNLLDTVHSALRSCADLRKGASERKRALHRLGLLSKRELEVFERVVAGQPSKVIAQELGVSKKTVDQHRISIMTKLEAKSVVDLVGLRWMARG